MRDANWDVRACAAIDALRAGVVNRYIAEHLTFGRDSEIEQIESTILKKSGGSAQVLSGGHGVGKSHLCEVIAARLGNAGYAVAKLELGASHGRAENPNAVLQSIAQALSLRAGGRRFRGNVELGYLTRASTKPQFDWTWGGEDLVHKAHRAMKGEHRLVERYDVIREAFHAAMSDGRPWLSDPELISPIPSTMTAANLAVAAVNQAAHSLTKAGCKGIVILFDEAERTTWAWTSYRVERARDLMLGFALASANKDTSDLKHYQNSTWRQYRPLAPSRMHALFCFTAPRGLAQEIASSVGTRVLQLPALDESALRALEGRIEQLYELAYDTRVRLNSQARAQIRAAARTEDTRGLVRRLVAALDQTRLDAAA